MSSLDEEWEKLVQEILSCRKCKLSMYRKNAVPGEGNTSAEIMFVGEAPGAREDETGRPFVGAAGQLLTELIESIGFKREDVYITNVVKCRPPNNRDPEEDEIKACSPYLIKQIQLIKPKIIIALGRHSARFLFTSAGITWKNMSVMHGKPYEVEIFGVKTILIATYHPAAALYNPKLRGSLERDFIRIREVYDKIKESSKKPRTLLDYLKSTK
ncbi:MAG: type-4 uracil-DNA glycosylase [Thermoprotei archaeon]